MAERQGFLYGLLTKPAIYETVQRFFGAGDNRRWICDDYVRAKPGDRVLDIGCGPAQILQHMDSSVTYIGWEPNADHVAAARQRYGARGTFHVGYFGPDDAKAMEPVDVAILLGVLHHMDDAQAYEIFALLRQVVRPGGRVLAIDGVFVDGQNPLARFVVSRDRGRNIRTPDGYKALAASAFTTITGDIRSQMFPPYTLWIMTSQ